MFYIFNIIKVDTTINIELNHYTIFSGLEKL